jgi:hypothetical protein
MIKKSVMKKVCSTHESLGILRGFVGKSEGNRKQGRPEFILVDITMDFREIGLDGMQRINLA